VRVLIDTHTLLWWDRQLRSLSRPLRAAIEDEANDIFVSAASIWEIAIKRAIGKLSFRRSIVDAVSEFGFEILAVSGSHAEHAGGLPRHHNDPSYCLTGECSRDVKRCLTKRAPVASSILRPSRSSFSDL